MKKSDRERKREIGWREWVSLPALGLPALKAKIDTGARTSALHTFELDLIKSDGVQKVRFGIHPLRREGDLAIYCEAAIIDQRMVTDSGGHREMRYVIETPVKLGDVEWPIEITLTSRESMRFRMLIGRTALRNNFIVNPGRSFLYGRVLRHAYRKRK